MNIKTIKDALPEYDQDKVRVYIDYLTKLLNAKNKDKSSKNPWMKYKTDDELISFFKKVSLDGLDFDGNHITLQSTGVSYDYIAFKNKMYLIYPESLIDVALVYKDDTFRFEKQSGKVIYTHNLNNPFNQEQSDIIGGYCVIKNKRGEFITLLSAEQIQKHRKIAKTDKIWSQWFHEMALKTLIKKACRQHFADIYSNIETLDNEGYDLEQPLGVSIEDKAAVEKIETIEELKKFWQDNQGRNAGILKDFNKLISNQKAKIEIAKIEADKRLVENTEEEPEKEPGSDG